MGANQHAYADRLGRLILFGGESVLFDFNFFVKQRCDV